MCFSYILYLYLESRAKGMWYAEYVTYSERVCTKIKKLPLDLNVWSVT